MMGKTAKQKHRAEYGDGYRECYSPFCEGNECWLCSPELYADADLTTIPVRQDRLRQLVQDWLEEGATVSVTDRDVDYVIAELQGEEKE